MGSFMTCLGQGIKDVMKKAKNSMTIDNHRVDSILLVTCYFVYDEYQLNQIGLIDYLQ